MNLTPDQADKLHAANLSNIVKKVKAGKVLSAYEQKQLAAATKESDEIVPQKKICEIFSITRKTIAQWRREGKEGVPKKETGGENLKKWREFFSSNPDAGFFDGKPRADRETLLCQKLEVDIEIAQIKKSQLDGRLMDMDEVTEMMTKMGATLKAALNKSQADLPPMLYGRTQHEMQIAIRTYMDKLLATLSDKESDLWSAK